MHCRTRSEVATSADSTAVFMNARNIPKAALTEPPDVPGFWKTTELHVVSFVTHTHVLYKLQLCLMQGSCNRCNDVKHLTTY